MPEAEPEIRQLVVAFNRGDEVVVYATCYGIWDVDDVIEDCRAKHGHALLLAAEDMPQPK